MGSLVRVQYRPHERDLPKIGGLFRVIHHDFRTRDFSRCVSFRTHIIPPSSFPHTSDASPETLRNFCLNAQPYRLRQGFDIVCDFSDEVSGSDVVCRIKITVILFSSAERADTVVAFASGDFTGAVITDHN